MIKLLKAHFLFSSNCCISWCKVIVPTCSSSLYCLRLLVRSMTKGAQTGILPTACHVPDIVAHGLVIFSSFFHSMMRMLAVLQGNTIISFGNTAVWSWTFIILFLQWFSYMMSSLETSRRKVLCASSDINMDLQYLGEEQGCVLLQRKASNRSAAGISYLIYCHFAMGLCSLVFQSEWLEGIVFSSVLCNCLILVWQRHGWSQLKGKAVLQLNKEQ